MEDSPNENVFVKFSQIWCSCTIAIKLSAPLGLLMFLRTFVLFRQNLFSISRYHLCFCFLLVTTASFANYQHIPIELESNINYDAWKLMCTPAL